MTDTRDGWKRADDLHWHRTDGINIHGRVSWRSGKLTFRVYRDRVGRLSEDLTGPSGRALSFASAEAAMKAADKAWPMEARK